jgi:hypothetical protein
VVAKPQWNGRRGTLVGALDKASGRYTVQVSKAEQLRLKPGNIQA